MKNLRQSFKKSFIRGALLFLLLVIVGFGFSFFQNMLDGVLKPLLNPFGISWLLNFPLVSILLFVITAILLGSLLSINSVRSWVKKIPLLSIPIKFSESVENLSGFPAVLVATIPGVYQIGFVTGTPRKNGVPEVGVFIPDLPSFFGGRILMLSLNNVELIIEPKNLGEMISAMMGSTQYNVYNVLEIIETAKSEFKTKPLKGMSYEQLNTVLKNARKIEPEENNEENI